MNVATLGTLTQVVLFAVGLVSIGLAMVGAHRRSARLVEAAVQATYANAAVAAFASSLIIYAFLADDFSIQYVHHTSDSAMPLFYKITAFWGGLDGSLLFWVLLLSVFSALAVKANRRRHPEMIPHVVWILGVINLFFVGPADLRQEPVRAVHARARDGQQRARAQPAAAKRLHGHPPAEPVPRLRLARGALRVRDGRGHHRPGRLGLAAERAPLDPVLVDLPDPRA